MKIIKYILVVLPYFFIGAGIGFYLGSIEKNFLFHLSYVLVISYLVLQGQTLLHEVGHGLFGKLSGYNLLSFRIGKHVWIKQNNHFEHKKYMIEGTGGQCLMSPSSNHYFLYNLGGSLLNLLVSLPALCLLFLPFSREVLLFLYFWASFGICFSLLNAIPMTILIDNDGKNAYQCYKSKEARECFFQQLKIVEALVQGKDYDEMEEKLFALPKNPDYSYSLIAAIAIFQIEKYLSCKQYQEALDLIEELLQEKKLMEYYRNTCQVYQYLCKCILDEDLSEIPTKKIIKKLKKQMNFDHVWILLALSKLNQEVGMSEERLSLLFEKEMKSYPYLATIHGVQVILEDIEEKAL